VLDVVLSGLVFESAADQSLSSEESMFGILYGLTLSCVSDVAGSVFGEGDNRGGGSLTFGVLDDLGVVCFHHGDAGVRRAQIDSDD